MHLHSSPGITAALALALALTISVLTGATALASGPATVTVRVEGSTQTLIGPTAVTTTAAPVVNDGKSEDACPGYSDLGALQLASAGNWSGKWEGGGVDEHGKFVGLGYLVETIAGESHIYEQSESFWDFWLNHQESQHGLCEAEGENGAEVLLFPCAEELCPTPLGIEAPAVAQVGEPVTVTVVAYSPTGAANPVAGASVSGGTSTVTTGSDGRAEVALAGIGTFTLSASAPEHVRDEVSVCVHNGNDGACGTGTPATGTGGVAVAGFKSSGPGSSYKGPYALVADVTSVHNGHTYTRANAPRLLAGTIDSHAAVSSVRLKLRRSYHGRCYSYDAPRGRFVRARCGSGSYFAASSSAAFSYLLPKRLGPGRYVLDVQAVDLAGNHTTLARGSSRVVFHVR